MLHTQLIEDRILYLEKELRTIQGISENPQAQKEQKPATLIKHMNQHDFHRFQLASNGLKKPNGNFNHFQEVSTDPKHVLEVLIPEPKIMGTGPQSKHAVHNNALGIAVDDEEKRREVDITTLDFGDPETIYVPDRLRIRSKILIEILEKISGINFGPIPHGKEKAVLLRPFKMLITFEKGIKEYLEKLEKLHRYDHLQDHKGDNSGSSKDGGTVQGPLQETESIDALLHMRLLVEFMEVDLKPLFELRRRINAGSLRCIAFADLWHLFLYGQEVKTTDEKLQLYQVLKVCIAVLTQHTFSTFLRLAADNCIRSSRVDETS